MGELRLPDHMRFCEIGNERIFLDLRADRYFRLPPGSDRAFLALESGAPASASDIAALRRLGLLVRAPEGRPIEPTRHAAPDSSFVEDTDLPPGFGLRALAEVAALVLRARRAVRRKRLQIELAAFERRASAIAPERCLERDVGEFLRARRLVPVRPNCLYDSLALRRFLARRGLRADLVIAAKLQPFAAHCWVQHGRTVLNDSLGSARDFAPILVA